MKFKKNILSISTSVAMLSMVGCGVTSQDDGQGEGSAVSGVAVDGYIAGGVVYIDTNENFEIDAWEPRAFTDERGYFTYAPAITDGNGNILQAANRYCDSAITDVNYQFCLKIPVAYDDVLVRITKGYDLTTAEPFIGTMTMKMSSNESELTKLNVVSPITGLLAKMSVEEKAKFLEIEGVPNLESIDFMDFSDKSTVSDEERAKILSLALLIHNVSNIAGQQIAEELHKSVTTSNSNQNKPNLEGMTPQEAAKADLISLNSFTLMASDNVLNALLRFFRDREDDSPVSNLLAMPSAVGKLEGMVFADMHENLKTRTKGTNTVIPDAIDLTAITTNVNNMRSVVVWSIEDKPDGMSLEVFVKGKLRATEVVSTLIKNKADPNAITNAINMSSNSDFLKNLADDKADVNNLKTRFTDNPGGVVSGDASYSSRECFDYILLEDAESYGLAGTGVNDLNTVGFAGNTLKMSEGTDEVVVNFRGELNTSIKGDMDIFVTFSKGDYAKLKDGVPEEQQFSGTWNRLTSCTMLLKVDVAGVIESVIVKPTISNSASAYNFDLGGEQRIWVPKTGS